MKKAPNFEKGHFSASKRQEQLGNSAQMCCQTLSDQVTFLGFFERGDAADCRTYKVFRLEPDRQNIRMISDYCKFRRSELVSVIFLSTDRPTDRLIHLVSPVGQKVKLRLHIDNVQSYQYWRRGVGMVTLLKNEGATVQFETGLASLRGYAVLFT